MWISITDANSNFSRGDYSGVAWGKYYFPLSHGFGGILGPVSVRVVDPLHVSDIFVKNKPTLHDVDGEIEIANEAPTPVNGRWNVDFVEAWSQGAPVSNPATVYQSPAQSFTVQAGSRQTVNVAASVPADFFTTKTQSWGRGRGWGARFAQPVRTEVLTLNCTLFRPVAKIKLACRLLNPLSVYLGLMLHCAALCRRSGRALLFS
ncbi:MAG: hypothetical protein ACAI35_25950 [Candidatus Methylacidiphilales bacterium]